MPQPADHPVPNHRVPDRLADHEPDARNPAGFGQVDTAGTHAKPSDFLSRDGMYDEPGTPSTAAPPGHEPKVVAAGQSGGRGEHAAQADRLLRPLRRRAARIALPARVRMRRRNPWVRARRRLLGWKVRLLTVGSPDTGSPSTTVPGRRSASRPTGTQNSPTPGGRPYETTHPRLAPSIRVPLVDPRGPLGDTPRTVICLPRAMSCGMAARLLACVLLVGQMGVGARCAGKLCRTYGGFRCGSSYLRAQLWTTLWMLPGFGPRPMAHATAASCSGCRRTTRGREMTQGQRGEGSS